jgi:hypothetical protein
MLVLDKHAALDHLVSRAIRQPEVVPEPFAAHVGAEPEFEPIDRMVTYSYAPSFEETEKFGARVGSRLLGSFWLRGGAVTAEPIEWHF